MKKVLGIVWKLNYLGIPASMERIVHELEKCGEIDYKELLDKAISEGFVQKVGGGFNLTEEGRSQIRIVVCGGVFDILHPGHSFILKESKSFGDLLVVIVARDSTVERRKRIPIVPEGQRADMVKELKQVDMSILGYEGDPLKIIDEIKPDIIAIGPDQHHDEEKINDETLKRGLNLEVKRIREYKDCDLNSTKSILQRIIERGYPDEREME